MSREQRITNTISKALEPKVFEIVNESHMHSGPRTESHFKVFVVSNAFQNKGRVERQQLVYKLLQDEFEASAVGGALHALSMRLKTPEEVRSKNTQVFKSPNCKSKP